MVHLAEDGERDAAVIIAAGLAELERTPEVSVDYLAVVDGTTLEPQTTITPSARVLFAGLLDGVRLIDNMELLPRTAVEREDGHGAGD